MGIPRLTSHLEAYQTNTTLGCTNRDCNNRAINPYRSVVIDGPGLAFAIYYRILGRNHGRNALEAQPSYAELGQAVVLALKLFERCGLSIKHVFFDGALPESKRPTRQDRLLDTLTRLRTYRSIHAGGFKTAEPRKLSIKPEEIFYPWSVPGFAKSLPPSPFLVPAVFEALKASVFADQTQLVPDEADAFLAAATRTSPDHLCLTGDSDLAIYDLGGSALTFFNSLDAQSCSACKSGTALLARTLQQVDIVSKIGPEATVEDLADLGFEIHEDVHVSFDEAIRRMKVKASKAEKARTSGFTKGLNSFAQDYTRFVDLAALSEIPAWCQNLDNRTSELAMQAVGFDGTPIHNYLLPLIEDTERASAWIVSRDIRRLSYSVLLLRTKSPAREIVEIGRSGQRIMSSSVDRLEEVDVQAQLQEIVGLQQQVAILGELKPADVAILFAVAYAYQWHLVEDKALPGLELTESALGDNKSGKLSWPCIHLRAQIHGILFSLRLLSQMLQVPKHAASVEMWPHLPILDIHDTLLTGSELSTGGLAQFAHAVIELMRRKHADAAQDREIVLEDTGDRDTGQLQKGEQSWHTVDTTGKGRKKRKRRDEVTTAQPSTQPKTSQNPFDLLR